MTEPAKPVLYVVKLPVETLVFETVILQAIAHARMRLLPAYRYDIIDSQKSEDRDITDKSP
jgi:hypothetical protein